MTTLQSPPQDVISRVQFSPLGYYRDPKLLVSSWDQTLRVYNTSDSSKAVVSIMDFSAPLWDACWDESGKLAYTAGLEKIVYQVDLESRRMRQVGQEHHQAVTSLLSRGPILLSGSLDKTVQLMDMRAPSAESKVLNTPGKVFCMDAASSSSDDPLLVLGLANRMIQVYDLRQMNAPIISRESTLKYATRSVKVLPCSKGYVVSSLDGRAAVEYILSADQESRGFGFRCHRKTDKEKNEDIALPVNALAFQPKSGVLYTGGSDQAMYSWDLNTKKKLKHYSKFPLSVMSMDIDSDGSQIAVGTSNDLYREDIGSGGHLAESDIHIINI